MKKLLWLALRILGLVALTVSAVSIISSSGLMPTAGSANTPGLLQFTSGGHALAFTAGAVHVVGSSHAYQVEFVDANPVAPVAGSTSVQAGPAAPLASVTYAGLWAGITLMYDAPAGSILRSTYRLEPLADPAAIRLRYNAPVRIDSDGTLVLAYAGGEMRESAPVAWQEIDRQLVPVRVAFTTSGQKVGFTLGAYDPAYPLFIDPMLTWNTFLGGSGDDEADSIAVDGNGNVYVAGFSDATWQGVTPPVRAFNGGNDTFVAKLDSSGSLVWNTFLGGSGNEYEATIAVDGSGNVYVAGYSNATWQGITPPVRAYTDGGDAFVARLDGTGALIWNTFLGGGGTDFSTAIAMDGSSHLVVTGTSYGTWQGSNPPKRSYTAGADGFIARLDTSGGLTWNTFLGGSGVDEGHGIAVVPGSGDLLVSGGSSATWQGVTPPVRAYTAGRDTFAAKLDSSGNLTWNTFLGGTGTEYEGFIAVDASGNAYLEGRSTATWQGVNPPVRAYTGSTDGFAAKLNSDGGLVWNTFLGGTGVDDAYGIAVDGDGNVYVTGDSNAAWGLPVRGYTALYDAFAAKLSNSGVLIWNSFLGGSERDSGYAVAVDGGGDIYVGGLSRGTWGAPARDFTGGMDALVVKLPSTYHFFYLPMTVK